MVAHDVKDSSHIVHLVAMAATWETSGTVTNS